MQANILEPVPSAFNWNTSAEVRLSINYHDTNKTVFNQVKIVGNFLLFLSVKNGNFKLLETGGKLCVA